MQNRKEIYDALVLKYKAQQQKAKTNLKVYFLGVVGVAEHPDVVDTVDKLLKEYAEATELLKILEENFDELAENTRLL
jgi:F0F1-type ATP synthase beta subunit|tara:strand:- start:172 stop:405 length:234 start_codon:yes stop_codon:yes gene_type:complete